MSHNLPKPVQDYLAAERDKDADAISRCFADDAVVHDEGKDHRGIAAIRDWKQEADEKYRCVLEPLRALQNDDQVTLRARVIGDFPGSPVELDFQFELAGDKIAALDIHA